MNFAPSDATDELGKQLGIPVEESPAQFAERWGTKAGSKTLFRESAVSCPRGDLDVVHSVAEASRCARRLAAADPHLERVMIKLDAAGWASGIGNAVISCRMLQRTGDLQRSVERVLQPWEDYARALQDSGAIVEEYVAAATCWPSAQGYVRRDGEFELLAVHEQILVEGEYLGCVFPLPQDAANGVVEAMARIAVSLGRRGFHGSFGVDLIVADGRIHATEINLRKIVPSHVIKAVHALAGDGANAHTHGSTRLRTTSLVKIRDVIRVGERRAVERECANDECSECANWERWHDDIRSQPYDGCIR